MGPAYKVRRPFAQTKTILKYLTIQKDPRLQRTVLQKAPDSVYKSICNAFKNIAENSEVILPKGQKHRLRKHKKLISRIISPNLSIASKRKVIQKGGNPFLVALLPAVISSAITLFGSAFMKKD